MQHEPGFIARLAALVPGPRSHLTRYHGVFAPHAKWRSAIVPGKPAALAATDRTPVERHKAMTWAQRLARVIARCCSAGVRSVAGRAAGFANAGHFHEGLPVTGYVKSDFG